MYPAVKWCVNRRDTVESSLRKMRKPSFKGEHASQITFTESIGVEEGSSLTVQEEGVDLGGLFREFSTLFFREVHESSKMLGGPEGAKMLSYHAPALVRASCTDYKLLGKFVALSLVQGGPGPNFFSEKVYFSVIGGRVFTPEINDIPDADVRAVLQQLDEAVTLDEVRTLLLQDQLQVAGLPSYISNLDEKDSLVQQALQFHGIVKVQPILKEFTEGLQLYGILPLMRNNPHLFQGVFCETKKPLTSQYLRAKFEVQRSPTGSNKFECESKVLDLYYEFLDDLETGNIFCPDTHKRVTLEDLLFFATGCDRIPPLGFMHQPKLLFHHCEDLKDCPLPKANTCVVSLYLPIKNDTYEVFQKMMVKGTTYTQGFGIA